MRSGLAHEQWADDFGVLTIGKGKNISSLIKALRCHIDQIEHRPPQFEQHSSDAGPWTFGIPAIDSHLASGGLITTGLHDIAPRDYGDMPAAMGFAVALAIRRLSDGLEHRPLLWCRLAYEEREYGRLYGHGLETLGLARPRFLTVTVKKPAALLWVMEEALKSGALALVIADTNPKHANLTATRRLSLAAQAGKSAGLMVFEKPNPGATSSYTRWIAAAGASQGPPSGTSAPGNPAWAIELTRARGGRPGAWTVEWHNATHRFDLVPGLSRGTLHPWSDEVGKITSDSGAALRAG